MSEQQPPLWHDWRIEPREYARQEARRGRRHAYDRLTPARTALVVIDMVAFFVAENPYCLGIVGNIARLAASMRTAGGLVCWVVPGPARHPDAARAFFGAEVAALWDSSAGPVWPALGPRADEPVLPKTGFSAFFPGNSALPPLLAARGIDSVLICGTVTNICCESAARDAQALGYRVVLLADACAARRDADHNAALHNVYRSFGDVRTTDEVIALLAAG